MDDLIYNQTKIPKEQWRYGLRTSADTGCGWIATYNALRLMGYKAEPEELIRYFSEFYPDFDAEAARKMLDELGISTNSRLKTLSKGNKEKVCLILVMSRNAKLYVLDEPIAGVDPAARDYVISTIINNYNPDACVLISTHLIADIEQILDEVIFLKGGNLVLQKTVDEVREEHGKSVDELFREVFKW